MKFTPKTLLFFIMCLLGGIFIGLLTGCAVQNHTECTVQTVLGIDATVPVMGQSIGLKLGLIRSEYFIAPTNAPSFRSSTVTSNVGFNANTTRTVEFNK